MTRRGARELPALGEAFGDGVVRSRKAIPGEGTVKTKVQSAWCKGQYGKRAGVPKTRRERDLRPPGTVGLQLLLLLQAGLRPLHSEAAVPGKMALGLGEANRPFPL